MAGPVQSAVQNRLLAVMRPDDFALLAPHLEPVDLPRTYILVHEERPIERVYFLESGIGSIVAVSPEGHKAESGIFGREGMSPAGAVMGVGHVAKREFMQVPGEGFAIDREAFESALRSSFELRELLNAFVYVMLIQSTYTSLSNAVHQIDERLARWLLMCDDRNTGSEIAITHEFISVMLAVRRPSVTTALQTLKGNGFIRSERGVIVICDRSALEDFARDAYGQPEREYRRLIGSPY